ncbi:MAG: STAS domain-containing protein [Planctomycetia bacterium]
MSDRAIGMDMSIERRADGAKASADAVVELVLSGRIDAESGTELEHAVAEELRRGHHAIRLDCTGVSFLSSAGIRVLFNVHRAAKAAGARCLIGAASEPVARVLEMTKLAPILREPQGAAETEYASPARAAAAAGKPAGAAGGAIPAESLAGRVRLIGLESPGAGGLQGEVVGSSAALLGRPQGSTSRAVPRHACGLGVAALSDDRAVAESAGEMLAACGAVFHRGPQPFAAIDYSLGEGSLVPTAHLVSGLIWEGLPRGRCGFEPAGDEGAVQFDELAAALLDRADGDCIAVVIAAEVQGLIGAELIRPLAEATADDHPRTSDPAVAARWLSFSREPVYARQTALVVGVVCRGMPTGALADFVRPLGAGGPCGHAHSAVFPSRPLKRGGVDLAATVADLAASEPLAVMHLIGDPHPVLGSGQSEFVRGCCWFAPLVVAGRTDEEPAA